MPTYLKYKYVFFLHFDFRLDPESDPDIWKKKFGSSSLQEPTLYQIVVLLFGWKIAGRGGLLVFVGLFDNHTAFLFQAYKFHIYMNNLK